MGTGLPNQYVRPHYQVVSNQLSRKGLSWRIHHGDASVDVVLAECTPTEWSTLEGLGSQALFNNAASAIWGTDYDNLSAAAKSGMKLVIDAGLP